MKIAHFLWRDTIGGAELFTLELSLRQAMANDVTIFYLGEKKAPATEKNNVKFVSIGIRSGFDIIGYLKLARYLSINYFDIIHIHQNITSLIIAIFFGKKAKIVKHEHGTVQRVWKTKRERALARMLSPFISLYIANSMHTKKRLVQYEKIDLNKIKVIPCGIDLNKFQYTGAKLRNLLYIPENSKVIGFVGRLHPQKGVEDFVTASEIIYHKNKNIFFVIVGDGILKNKIETRINTSKVKNNTLMLGFREDIPDLMAIMDLIIIPSNWEPQGIVAIEAMATGTPIVAFDVGGLSEVIGEAGILIKNRDTAKLADQAYMLLEDENLRAKYRRKGIEQARQFGLEAVEHIVMDNYNAILGYAILNH